MLVRVSSVGRDRDQQFVLQERFIADLQQAAPGYFGLPQGGLVKLADQ